ncbi:hypothetical protein D3C86_1431870 [compost metagenome]
MRAMGVTAVLIGSLYTTATGCASGPPKLLPNAISVSKPVQGVSTVSFAGRVTGISFEFPRRLPKSISDESKDPLNKTVLVAPGFLGDYRSFTVGSRDNPLISGDLIVAQPFAVGFFSPIVGGTVSILVP